MRRRGSDSAFVEHPDRDARQAEPSWLPTPWPAAHLVDVPDSSAPIFDLWAISGAKRLIHDGRNLALTRRAAGEIERATLGRGLEQGQPFGVAAPPVRARPPAYAAGAARAALAHMRALLALDAKVAGASDFQISCALVPGSQFRNIWSSDSAERALVRDALKRGRAYREGRWAELVWGAGRGPLPA